jgi:hypothetical protein
MKLAHTLFATAAMIALAGPAFAQAANPTLSINQTSTQSSVTTTVDKACAITGTLSPFLVTVSPNGVVSLPGAQAVTVTCNTPRANLTMGASNMINSTAPAIIETGTFTNVLNINGFADDYGNDFFLLDARASTTSRSSASDIGLGGNRRVRTLQLSVEGGAPDGGKLPVAGNYVGSICLTVDPSGSIIYTGSGSLPNADVTCAS